MAKVLTRDEQQLFNDLTKLARKANQRIIRLEKETRLKAPFEVKQLYDYIDTFAITKSGRAKISKTMSEKEMKIEAKALKDFLGKSLSTVKGVKKYKSSLEKEIGKKLTYGQAQTIYTSGKHYSWIYEYIPKSEFWGYWVKIANAEDWSQKKWINEILERIQRTVDEELKQDLVALYIYIKD